MFHMSTLARPIRDRLRIRKTDGLCLAIPNAISVCNMGKCTMYTPYEKSPYLEKFPK